MAAKYIFPVLAVAFLAMALFRLMRDKGRIMPASRTWIMVSLIFGAVSVWLWSASIN